MEIKASSFKLRANAPKGQKRFPISQKRFPISISSLRDMSLQQRDYLQSVREQLALRAKQGVIEFEVTDEMLSNEQQFLDRFQQMLAKRRAGGE